MYVPEGPKPKFSTSNELNTEFYDKTHKGLPNFPSQKFPKVKTPLVENYELDEAFENLDVSGLDNN